MLACDNEVGFQNLHVYLQDRFCYVSAKPQISSGVLLLLCSDTSPACSLCTGAMIYCKGAASMNTSISI